MENGWNLLQNDETICPRGWGMRRECALFYRVYYILGGEAWCRMEGEPFALERGTLYIFPMMTPYDLWQNAENPLEVLWFHAALAEAVFPTLVRLPIRSATALDCVLQALRQANNGSAAVKELAGAILTLAQEEASLHGVKSRRMRRVDQWIDAHIGEAILVEELAALAGLERSYFSREFHRTMRVSPQQYILAKKMSAAARQLQRGESVAQTATSVGYLSEKAFSRAFKLYMEQTPRDYKKSHIAQP